MCFFICPCSRPVRTRLIPRQAVTAGATAGGSRPRHARWPRYGCRIIFCAVVAAVDLTMTVAIAVAVALVLTVAMVVIVVVIVAMAIKMFLVPR